jgi:hypothetical protein
MRIDERGAESTDRASFGGDDCCGDDCCGNGCC